MKSYIWLQTTDGSIQQVEEDVAMFCPMICREVLQTGMGSSKNYAISLPQRVNPAILGLILDYCRFHQVPGRSNKVYPVLCCLPSFKNCGCTNIFLLVSFLYILTHVLRACFAVFYCFYFDVLMAFDFVC